MCHLVASSIKPLFISGPQNILVLSSRCDREFGKYISRLVFREISASDNHRRGAICLLKRHVCCKALYSRRYLKQEHRYPMNNPSAENNRWKLYKLVEANIQSYAGMGAWIMSPYAIPRPAKAANPK